MPSHAARLPCVASLITCTAVGLLTPLTAVAQEPLKVEITEQDGKASHSKIGVFGITDIAFSPDGKTVATASGGDNRQIHLYDMAANKTRVIAVPESSRLLPHIEFTADGRWLAYGGRIGVQVFDPKTGQPHALFGSNTPVPGFDTHASPGMLPPLLSPDGKRVVTVQPGDVGDGQAPPKPSRPTPKGKRKATGGGSVNVQFWDIETKANIHSVALDGEEALKNHAEYSPDGRSVVIALRKDLVIIDAQAGKLAARLTGVFEQKHRRTPFNILADGRRLYLHLGGEVVQPISLARLEAPRLLARIKGLTTHEGLAPIDHRYSPAADRWYVELLQPYSVGIVDQSLKLLRQFDGAKQFAVSADGKTAVWLNTNARQLVFVDARTGEELGYLPCEGEPYVYESLFDRNKAQTLALSPDGTHVAYVTSADRRDYVVARAPTKAGGGVLKVVAAKQAPAVELNGQPMQIVDAAFSQNNAVLVVRGLHAATVVVDVETLAPRAPIYDPIRPKEVLSGIGAFTVAPTGATGQFITQLVNRDGTKTDPSVIAADLKTGKSRVVDAKANYVTLAATPDGKHRVAVVNAVNEAHGKLVFQSGPAKLKTLESNVKLEVNTLFERTRVAPSDDGRWVFARASRDNGAPEAMAWNTETGEAGALAGNPHPYRATFLADNKTLAVTVAHKQSGAGHMFTDVVLYDVETGQETRRLVKVEADMGGTSGHGAYLSPAGDYFAVAGGGAGELFLKSLETGKLVARLSGHTAQVYFARFSPDGRKLITFSHDKTMRLWDIPGKTAAAE